MVSATTRQIIMAAMQTDLEMTDDEKKTWTRLLNGAPRKAKLLTAKQACEILGCSVKTLRSYEKAGRIESIHHSKRRVRYREDDVVTLTYGGTDKL